MLMDHWECMQLKCDQFAAKTLLTPPLQRAAVMSLTQDSKVALLLQPIRGEEKVRGHN